MNSGNVEDIYPLSPMQHGMLFHGVYSPEAGLYQSQLTCTFEGGLDADTFARAWQEVVNRHTIFRTAFVWEELDQPLQVVYRDLTLPCEQLDWRALSPAEQQERLETYLEHDRARGFDFAEAPLMRISLIRVSEAAYQFTWTYHHMLMDAWSESLVVNEVFAFYWTMRRGEILRLEPSQPYGDYIEWLQRQNRQQAETFWRHTLRGFTRPTVLSRLRINSVAPQAAATEAGAADVENFGEQRVQLSGAETAAVQAAARQCQVTLNTLMQGAWALILGHYSGEADVVFGANVSGRPASLPGGESIIGILINTLRVRVRLDQGQPFVTLLRALQDNQAVMREYEYSPLVEVQEWAEVSRGTQLFESILVFQNAPVNTSLRKHWDAGVRLEINNVKFRGGWTNFALAVDIRPGAELLVNISHNRASYSDSAVGRLIDAFQTVLGAFAAGPEIEVSALGALLGEANERRRLREEQELEAASLQTLKKARRRAVGPAMRA